MELELSDSTVWDDPGKAQKLGQERAALDAVVGRIDSLVRGLADLSDIVELASEEHDDSLLYDASEELDNLGRSLESLEFQRMFLLKLNILILEIL